MGIFDDFEYKEKCQNEEKVIEVLKRILKRSSGWKNICKLSNEK